MFERLEAILERYEKINEMMADPAESLLILKN